MLPIAQTPPAPPPVVQPYRYPPQQLEICVAAGLVVGTAVFLAALNYKGFDEDASEAVSPGFNLPVNLLVAPEKTEALSALEQKIDAAIAPSSQPAKEKKTAPAFNTPPVTVQQPSLSMVYYAGMVSLIGDKGSGKTAAGGAICRHRLEKGHTLRVFNHHYEFGSYAPFKLHELGQPNKPTDNVVYGVGETLELQFQSISEGLIEVLDECDRRYYIRQSRPKQEWDFMNSPITVKVEELGEYKGNIDSKLIQRFLKCVCIKFRKANMYFVGISQNDTMEMFGGVTGLADMLQNGVVKLELLNKPDPTAPGGLSPTGQGWLSVNGSEPILVDTNELKQSIPAGQDDLDFSDLFSNKTEQKELPIEPLQHQSIVPTSPNYKPSTPAHLREILEFAVDQTKRNGLPITAQQVYEANLPSATELNLQAHGIRYAFDQLVTLGYGYVLSEGEESKFLVKPTFELLPTELQLVVKYARTRGWVNANQVKSGIRPFRDNKVEPNVIRSYFQQLINLGLGEPRGGGENLEFCLTRDTQDNP